MTTPDLTQRLRDNLAIWLPTSDHTMEARRLMEEAGIELERLRAQVAAWESELTAVMPADFKDWHENGKAEWPRVTVAVIEGLRASEAFWIEAAGRAQVAPAGMAETLHDLALELVGVIIDTEETPEGFDAVCLRTVKRVQESLSRLAASPAAPAQQAEAPGFSDQAPGVSSGVSAQAPGATPSLTVGDERIKLQHIASLAHEGGLSNLNEHGIMCEIRRLSLPYWDDTGTYEAAVARVNAALAAAKNWDAEPAAQAEPVASDARDAARYRWLKESVCVDASYSDGVFLGVEVKTDVDYRKYTFHGAELPSFDEAVDAAMKKEAANAG